MNQLIGYALVALLTCLYATFITVWVTRKNNENASEIIQTRIASIREEVQALLDTEFEQFRPLISRSMTLAANAGAQVKKTQAFEREIVRTIQADLPITPEMITAFSPKLGEMVEENPELLIKGHQVLQRLLGDGGGSAAESRRRRIDRRPEI